MFLASDEEIIFSYMLQFISTIVVYGFFTPFLIGNQVLMDIDLKGSIYYGCIIKFVMK